MIFTKFIGTGYYEKKTVKTVRMIIEQTQICNT